MDSNACFENKTKKSRKFIFFVGHYTKNLFSILGESSPEDKLHLYQVGILKKICALIKECSNLESNKSREGSGSSENKRKRNASNQRKNSAANERGIGYGRGSTKSRWDIERTVKFFCHIFKTMKNLGGRTHRTRRTFDVASVRDDDFLVGRFVEAERFGCHTLGCHQPATSHPRNCR